MPHALALAAILALITLPVAGAIATILSRRGALSSGVERAAAALLPLAPLLLGEILVAQALPWARPLRAGVPILHALVLVVACVVLWRDRGTWVLRANRAIRGSSRYWFRAPIWMRVVIVAAGASLALAFVYGAWTHGDEHDGGAYREVMALAAFQDGRVRAIEFPYSDFADAYPRTVELLYSWTILCTGRGVGFHLVNWLAHAVASLAMVVGARRLGLRHRDATVAFALFATTPLALFMSGVLYNDLAAAAPCVLAMAFALARRDGSWGRADLGMVALGLALGAASKFNVAIAAALVALVRVVATPARPTSGPGRAGVGATLLAAGAAASIPYIRSWILYASPIWPVRLAIGSREIFPGFLTPDRFQIGTKGPWAHRWARAVYELFQNVSQDSNGAFGLVFAIVGVPALVAATLAPRRPTMARVMLVLVAWHVLLIPHATNLRYCFASLGAVYLVVALAGPRIPRGVLRSVASIAVAAMILVNAADYARSIARRVATQVTWGVSLVDPVRNRRWHERADWLEPGVAPETFAAVQRRMRPGERLVYAVLPITAFLYDPSYRYAIEFRSVDHFVRRTPAGPRRPSGMPEIDAWGTSLHLDGIEGVLVYEGSNHDAWLSNTAHGFRLVYAQRHLPPGRRVRLYRVREPEPDGARLAE